MIRRGRSFLLLSSFLSAFICVHPRPTFARSPATTQAVSGSAQVAALVAEFGERLTRSRYMEQGEPRDVVVPGWEGFPTKRYTYRVTDKDGINKSADVVMLNPTPTHLATWIVSAIREVRGGDDDALARRAFAHVIAQSGGQFPVAGIVYEDILPADGAKEAYCFRDGVTVAVTGVQHRTTKLLTPEQVEASINGPVVRVFTYARIASTTPQQFVAIGGDAGVVAADGKPTPKWPLAIRKAYQEAWASERNALIVAWIKAQK